MWEEHEFSDEVGEAVLSSAFVTDSGIPKGMLRRLLDSSSLAVISLDREGRVTSWNTATEKDFGWSAREALGKRPPSIRLDELDLFGQSFSAALGGDSRRLSSVPVRTKSGLEVARDVSFYPVTGDSGVEGCVVISEVSEAPGDSSDEDSDSPNSSNARLMSLFDSVGEGLLTVDEGMRVTLVNSAAARMLGREAQDVVGHDIHDFIGHSHNGQSENGEGSSRCIVALVLATGERRNLVLETFRKKSGQTFLAESSYSPIREEGRITGASVLFRDVTEKKAAERKAREREERFRVLFQNSTDIILITDDKRVIRYASPSVEKGMGYRQEDLVGVYAPDLIHPEDRERITSLTTEARRVGGITPVMEVRWRHADGSWRYHEAVGNNLHHEPSIRGMVFNLRDVTERRTLEDQLSHQAFHDSLTGMPNRELFLDRLDIAVKRSRRNRRSVAVLFMDLDNFKVVNDTLGHEFGDVLLVEVANRIRNCLRETDTAARFGGDEFTVLLEEIGQESDAIMVAERIHAELRRPFTLGNREVFVTTSIGVSLNNIFGDEEPQDLLRQADIAVYQAKGRGRDDYAIFDPSMNARALDHLALGNDLKRALEREEFVLLYQPKISLQTGEATAVEALLYWDHPERGRLSPADFIPLSEETGAIVPMGRWVLREACFQLCAWQEEHPNPPKHVSVNLSVVQIRSRTLIEDVQKVLEESGLDPSCLGIEVTETLLLDDLPSATHTLQGLRELGVMLAMDDFGTGYSSLSALRELTLDALKVDKAFVDGLGRSDQETKLVNSVIELAHTLSMKVVAEGVETQQQLDLLRAMECEMAQGYHFSRPLPPDGVVEFFGQSRLW